MKNYELAKKLVDFAETVDPWGISDACGDTDNAVELLADHLEDDAESIVDWLISFVDEDEDTSIVKIIKSLLDNIDKMERETA